MKKILIVLISIFVILILTKPSYSDFRHYTSAEDFYNVDSEMHQKQIQRKSNDYIIFCVYELDIYRWQEYTDPKVNSTTKFIGIFNNFFEYQSS